MHDRGIFWRLCRHRPSEQGLSVEDFFTELWAYVLKNHLELRNNILSLIGAKIHETDWCIETQVEYPPASLSGSKLPCRPDLRLSCQEACLLFEHKIDAKQHYENIIDDLGFELAYSQLERYLATDESARVVLISLGTMQIDSKVLNNPRYLRPKDRPHFLWGDFYPIVQDYAAAQGKEDLFIIELRRFMEALEMMPPREGVGIIPSANEPGMKAERAAMKRFWEKAIETLRANGWIKIYWGLEIEVRHPEFPDVKLSFEMRFGERMGQTDGFLKVRLRILDGEAIDRDCLKNRLSSQGYVARVYSTKTSEKPPRKCWDIIGVTRVTRPEYIGEGDPGDRLADFVLDVLDPIHSVLGLPQVHTKGYSLNNR